MPKRFVIIGGDAAGMSAASKIKRMVPDADIRVFEKGKHISYAACGMPYWLSGVIDDGAKLQVLTPEVAREKRGINVEIDHEVTAIHPEKNLIDVENLISGELSQVPYDSLLIATGARSVIPPIPGVDLEGVFTLRTLADGHKIKQYLTENAIKHATVIGGGYIGLEMAESFRHQGIHVTMIEMLDQIAGTFDKDIMTDIQEHLVHQEVDLRLESRVQGITKSEGRLKIETDGGDLSTDMVIVSTGVRPNAELAASAGIKLGKSGAISINSEMQTNLANIYAAGDCAEYKHLVLERDVWIPLAPSANKGGRIAGENMAGGKTHFPGILGTAVVKVFDYTIAQTGLTEKQARQEPAFAEIETTMIKAGSKAHYYPGSTPVTVKLIVEKSSHRLLGAQMIGRQDVAKRLDVLATAITAGMTVDQIALLDLTYAPPVAPVYDPIHVAAGVANK